MSRSDSNVDIRVAVLSGDFGSYSYRIAPDSSRITAADAETILGRRVLVPFGHRTLVGVVTASGVDAPPGVTLKSVHEILDPWPVGPSGWMDFLDRVAAYYLQPLGAVLKTAIPAGLGKPSATRLKVEAEHRALEPSVFLQKKLNAMSGSIAQVRAALASSSWTEQELISSGVLSVEQQGPAQTAPKTETLVRFCCDVPVHARAHTEAEMLSFLRQEERAHTRILRERWPNYRSSLNRLIQKGAVVVEEVPMGSEDAGSVRPDLDVEFELTDDQSRTLCEIERELDRSQGRPKPVLLQGVTGSGKTEVYLRLARQVLDRGSSVLYLVPEIGLTPALLGRVRARFGDSVAILHSGLSQRARIHEWWRIRTGRARMVLGVRSAVFAPIEDLGLIVVDEEHDSAYKQVTGVRYNARDMALLRGHLCGALTVLGSATPSMESVYQALEGRYLHLHMHNRATKGTLPKVELLDLRTHREVVQEAVEGSDTGAVEQVLTGPLLDGLRETLGRGEQAIVLLNRRGYAPWVQCLHCGESLNCEHCAVTMAWHQRRRHSLCHICGARQNVPDRCPSCGSSESLEKLGFGTQRLEEVLKEAFPHARVARMDRDERAHTSVSRLVRQMNDGKIDILVGTQMVAKGHDFPNVTLVGVVLADQGLRIPDFRGAERTFQLLTQVAGRAGRGDRPGRVLVQTYTPDHSAIRFAANHDVDGFLAVEMGFRQRAGYPPFQRLSLIEIQGEQPGRVDERSFEIHRAIVENSPESVEIMGPAAAGIPVIRGKHRVHIALKTRERTVLRGVLRNLVDGGHLVSGRGVRVILDVDPLGFQ